MKNETWAATNGGRLIHIPHTAAIHMPQVYRRLEPVVKPNAEIEDDRARCEEDYGYFFRQAWHVLEPGPLVDEWYIDAIVAFIHAIRAAQIKNGMIHLRPRMLKTLLCSVGQDAWVWTTDPRHRILSSSFSNDRRKDDCRLTRSLITSDWYQARWPHVQIEQGQNEKHRFQLVGGGQRYTSIYGTGATGDGGLQLRLDDPQADSDMDSPTKLRHDHRWFYSTWERRANDPENTPNLILSQRLGPFDLPNCLRCDDPNRWEVLSLETRKTSVLTARFFKLTPSGVVDEIILPRTTTDVYQDPRAPGELLSSRVIEANLNMLQQNNPAVYAAQEDQAPIRTNPELARVFNFERERHMASFAQRMGCQTLREACGKAMRTGWTFTSGGDHGIDTRREWWIPMIYHDHLKELWALKPYINSGRDSVQDDAMGIRAIMDELGIPIHRMVNSRGDVGSVKTMTSTTPKLINQQLMTVQYPKGHSRYPQKILGFAILTPNKGQGSVDTGVELLNGGFGNSGEGSNTLMLDNSCGALADCLEQWQGGEESKDGVDAFRYKATDILKRWLYQRPGASGSAGG